MTFSRVFWPFVLAAALAACSGNLGGGQSTLPGTLQPGGTNVQQVAPPVATASPVSASNVATVGDSIAPQALPAVMGWGGSIAFPKPSTAPAASPKATATATPSDATAAKSVSIGITAAVVEPSDAPHFDSGSAKRRGKHDSSALFFISLLATSDLTLGEYPKIAVDVPRDIASKHRDDTFALALYDPEQKVKAYQLSVAERDFTSPAPGSLPTPVVTPVPTPANPTPLAMPNAPGGALTPPPVGGALEGGNSLPPEHIAFQGTATTLTLKANRPVVFAFYVVPPQPSPSPSGSPNPASTASGVPSPVPSGSSTPQATAKPVSVR